MKKRIATAVASCIALAAVATTGFAQETVELKFAHWLPPAHPLHPSFTAWGESIAEASGGSLKVTIYPSQQLGPAKDHYEMARTGIADITFINPGYTPGQFPVIAVGELPFLFTNAVEGSAAIDEWYRRHNREEMKDVHFCMATLHDPGTFHSKKPITHPDDVKGLKVRPAHATMARFVRELGGASVQVSAPEARDALAKGTADAITFPWGSIKLFGIDKVTKHHMDLPLYVTTFIILMNQSKYDSLSADQQRVIDDHCTSEWAQKVSTPWSKMEASGRDAFAADPEHHLHKPTPDEVAAWRAAALPLKEAWAEDVRKVGQDPDALYQDLIETARKYDSLYE